MKVIKEKGILYFSDENRGDAKFSLIDGSMAVKRYDKWESRKTLSNYFANLRVAHMKNENWFDDSDKSMVILLDIVKSNNKNCVSISTFLERMFDFAEIEKLISSGVNLEKDIYYSRIKDFKFKNINKEVLQYLRESNVRVYCYQIHGLCSPNLLSIIRAYRELNIIENFNLDEWLDVLYYRTPYLDDIFNKFNYDTKSFIRYVDYITEYENIGYSDVIHYLRDYYFQKLRMSKKNKGIPNDNMKIDGSIEKYPKYLRSIHDITSKQYSVFSQKYDEELFVNVYKDLDLNFEGKKYSIVIPNSTSDVIDEGMQLNHCVKSYINYVLDGKCHILFMRNNDDIKSPFITLELRGNKIIQAKAIGNTYPEESEIKFIKKYCKNKNFEFKC